MAPLPTTVLETTPSSAQCYHSYLLPSGLRVVIYTDDNPVSYAGYFIGAGSANDPLRFHGVAHFAEHMLFKGTKRRNARQIINRMEEVGADFNAFTTKEDTFVYTAFPYAYFSRVLDMMTDVVCNSSCPEEELLKEREVIIEEINSYLDSPADRIFDEYENLLFHGTPLGHNILGTVQSVERINSEAVRHYMRGAYIPQNMVFCYRGKPIDNKRLFEFLQFHFPATPPQEPDPSSVIPAKKNGYYPMPLKREVSHRYKTYQVHRIIGCHAYSMKDEGRIGLTLLNNILGGRGMNSRLNLALREDEGLVYTVESGFYPYRNAGFLSIYFGTTKEKLNRATQVVKKEMERLKTERITDEALRTAKRQFLGQLTVQDDSRESCFLEMGKSFYYFGLYNTPEQVELQIEKLTPAILQQIACDTFRDEKLLVLTYY